MTNLNRRMFFLQAIVVSAAVSATKATAQAKLDESDPQAMALGYKHDTKAVDSKKYPKHDVSQTCSNCQLFQGKPEDEWGGCALFPGKQVAAAGWCSAWVKKAG